MATPAAGSLIRASDAFQMTLFTPSTTNITIGTGATSEGWYQQIGSMVLWGFRIEFGTSPSFASAGILVALPVTAYTGGGAGLQATLGSWIMRTASTSHYGGSMGAFESAGLNASFSGAWNGSTNGNNGRIAGPASTGIPAGVTIAATNVLSGSGVYRAA